MTHRGEVFRTNTEVFYETSGIHRFSLYDGTKITGVSANDWKTFLRLLKQTNPEDTLIASPELMTLAGTSLSQVGHVADSVRKKVEGVVKFSRSRPRTTFVLGTPVYSDESPPFNGALIIQDGDIIAETHKRAAASHEESTFFTFDPDASPLLLPNTSTNLLICADLPTSTYFLDAKRPVDRLLELAGKQNLIGKSPEFFSPSATSVLVLSCWGVGSRLVQPGNANRYYRNQLLATANTVMRKTPIQQIVMVDRVPTDMPKELQDVTPTIAYNCSISKAYETPQSRYFP